MLIVLSQGWHWKSINKFSPEQCENKLTSYIDAQSLINKLVDNLPGSLGFPGGLAGKESACNVGDLGQSLGWEDPLEKDKATHSSILA